VRRAAIAAAVVLAAGAGVALAATSGDDPDEDPVPAGTAATDRWIALRGATLARTEVAAARIGRFIYVFGGFARGRAGEPTTAALERYDIRRNRWRRVRSAPVGLNHAAAAAYRGRLYVHGGYRSRTGLSNTSARLYRYNPRTNRWRRLRGSPRPRAAHALGVIRGRLYAAGGANEGRALDTMDVYSFRRRRWRRGPRMRTRPREHLAGVASRGFLYVIAGRANGVNFTDAERYNPRRGRWEVLPDIRRERGGIAAAAVGRRVVVFGGEESAGTIGEVELYDPRTRRWTMLPRMRTPRHGLGGAARGRRVYAIEGGPQPGFAFSNALEALDLP
jgi:hypothetical protein